VDLAGAWERFDADEADPWATFETRFAFTPGARPAIDEPSPSVTIDLAPIFGDDQARFNAGETAVNAITLVALTKVFHPGQPLFVVDWQHPSYRFWPHRQALTVPPQWPVGVFPNGDYHGFVSEDFTIGTFGHPWEETLCVFGQPLIDVLVPMLTAWLPILRRS
jgi:hypothetical protein